MANTYSQIYLQIVFAVQGRHSFIHESFREELQKYMSGVIAKREQKLYAIYCMPDHTHILISYKPSGILISDLVRDIKASSSAFIKEKNGSLTDLAGKPDLVYFLIQRPWPPSSPPIS